MKKIYLLFLSLGLLFTLFIILSLKSNTSMPIYETSIHCKLIDKVTDDFLCSYVRPKHISCTGSGGAMMAIYKRSL